MILLIALVVFCLIVWYGGESSLGGALFASFFIAACVYWVLF